MTYLDRKKEELRRLRAKLNAYTRQGRICTDFDLIENIRTLEELIRNAEAPVSQSEMQHLNSLNFVERTISAQLLCDVVTDMIDRISDDLKAAGFQSKVLADSADLIRKGSSTLANSMAVCGSDTLQEMMLENDTLRRDIITILDRYVDSTLESIARRKGTVKEKLVV